MHYCKIGISFQWSKMTSLQTVRPILKQCSTTRVRALRVPSSIRDFRTTPSTLRGNSSFRTPGTVSNQYYQYIATIMWERSHFLLSLAIYNKTQLKEKMLIKNSLLQCVFSFISTDGKWYYKLIKCEEKGLWLNYIKLSWNYKIKYECFLN